MISTMDRANIISLHKIGHSNRKIAKELGIHRNTVNKTVNKYKDVFDQIINAPLRDDSYLTFLEMVNGGPKKKQERKKKTFSGRLKQRFEELLEDDNERNELLGRNKQQLNAAVLHRKLKAEGFNVGESTVRLYFSQYKKKHPEVFIRQEYAYGERMEFDFHQIKLCVAGEITVYHQATISFPRSNHIIAYLYKNEQFTSIMNALIRTFEDINGVPQTVVFDNMRPIVNKFLYGGGKVYTTNILHLSAYYGFQIFTCNPYSGNEKGHVENSGKNTRTEFFSLKYKFNSEKELYEYFNNQLIKYNSKSNTEWEIEKQYLMKKPFAPFVVAELGEAMVNSYSIATIKRNHYSVKEEYVGQKVEYAILNNEVIISKNGEEIGRHKKVDGHDKYVIDINHFLNTFLKKPASLKNSVALKQASKELQAIYDNNYKDNPKGFILYLLGQKIQKHSKSTIEEVSTNQLDSVSKIFGQA